MTMNNNANSAIGELQDIQRGLRLNSKNYLEGKEKLSHLLGTGQRPGNSMFAWDEEDSTVMSWFSNAMTICE